jgi:2-oxoacid:acceptor oxidoreductase delta subunit (pyruvate/2-ketoisovalerate family)
LTRSRLVNKLPVGPIATHPWPDKTGHWRTIRPEIDLKLCKKCRICLPICPDGSVYETPEGYVIDYEYCKGCGICANECPFKAIKMVREPD